MASDTNAKKRFEECEKNQKTGQYIGKKIESAEGGQGDECAKKESDFRGENFRPRINHLCFEAKEGCYSSCCPADRAEGAVGEAANKKVEAEQKGDPL